MPRMHYRFYDELERTWWQRNRMSILGVAVIGIAAVFAVFSIGKGAVDHNAPPEAPEPVVAEPAAVCAYHHTEGVPDAINLRRFQTCVLPNGIVCVIAGEARMSCSFGRYVGEP